MESNKVFEEKPIRLVEGKKRQWVQHIEGSHHNTHSISTLDNELSAAVSKQADRNKETCGFTNGIDVSVEGLKGGLSLGWKEGIMIKVRSYSNSHIDIEVMEETGEELPSNNILERLDRGVANPLWWDRFPNYLVHHQNHSIFDHYPVVLSTMTHGSGRFVYEDSYKTHVKTREELKLHLNSLNEEDPDKDNLNCEELRSKVHPSITRPLNEELCKDFREEEVVEALKGMTPLKASGNEKYPAFFFQKFWHIVRKNVVTYCLQELKNGKDFEEINKTNIVIVPKVQAQTNLGQFKLISLCNIVYNIILKVVVNRFQKKRGGSGSFALKLNISKAYDRVEWNYLEDMIKMLGFCNRWIELVMSILFGDTMLERATMMKSVVNEYESISSQQFIGKGNELEDKKRRGNKHLELCLDAYPWQWKIWHLLEREQVEAVLTILLVSRTQQDILTWRGDKSGDKIKIKLWRITNNYLSTLSNLKIQRLGNDVVCPICSEEEETMEHLFRDCKFTRKAVWYNRNKFYYKGKKWSVQEVVGFIKAYVLELNQIQTIIEINMKPKEDFWRPPKAEQMKEELGTPTTTEAKACLQAIIFGEEMRFRDLVVEVRGQLISPTNSILEWSSMVLQRKTQRWQYTNRLRCVYKCREKEMCLGSGK
ncbi:hypothetical protein Gohar_018607, partial [Gossypium harknessii]|nr:hypothetical protein [Gossypium harknessii]